MNRFTLLVVMFTLLLLPLLPASSQAATGTQIVRTAKSYIGDFRYKYGAEPWNTGFRYADCSSFVQQVFNRKHGYQLPRTSLAQAKTGKYVAKKNLRAGDLVFFDTNRDGRINHVGIYIGKGNFVHSSPVNKVGTNELDRGYWKNAYKSARRVL